MADKAYTRLLKETNPTLTHDEAIRATMRKIKKDYTLGEEDLSHTGKVKSKRTNQIVHAMNMEPFWRCSKNLLWSNLQRAFVIPQKMPTNFMVNIAYNVFIAGITYYYGHLDKYIMAQMILSSMDIAMDIFLQHSILIGSGLEKISKQ